MSAEHTPEVLDYAEEPPVIRTIDARSPDNLAGKVPKTAKEIFFNMLSRQRHLGSPLPEGYVPPPGIDIEALLQQLPPPPPRPPAE